MDVVKKIMEQAPQLGTTCRVLNALLPKIDRDKNPGIRFPSVDTKPWNLVEIRHGGLTFLYATPKNALSYKWDGDSPAPHGAGGRYIYKCDFCEENDE